MNIGHSIKTIRKERTNLNQSDFAQQVGITQTYLSLIESGKKKPSTDILEKIAKEFEVPLFYIFWNGIEISDIEELKKPFFRILKPAIDGMIKSFIE